jgi:hypothetical protein
MSNYRSIPSLLSARQPFEGNSMSARLDGEGNYIIFSYATEIARVDAYGDKTFNDHKYSTTTSRHQNLVHANL